MNLVATSEVGALGQESMFVDRNGNITYTVYDDPDHEARTYAGWNNTTDLPTGPTVLVRDDLAQGYVETITMSATPDVSNGQPTGTEAISDLQTLGV